MLRFIFLALGLAACGAQSNGSVESDEVYAGNPKPPASAGAIAILDNPGFRVGYSERHRQPLWVAFRARSVEGLPRIGERPRYFSPDKRLKRPVTSWDYVPAEGETVYTRGHMAPNYLIGKLHGREGQLATFLLSNVSPQTRRLNSLAWQRLEEAEVDIIAPAFEQLWVLTGPVFGDAPPELKRSTGIPVPEAFWRIWLDVLPDGSPRVLAFIVPQEACGTEPLSQFLATVDEIEARTGLDFYAPLDDAVEDALERSRDTDGWQFRRINQRKPRYGKSFEGETCVPVRG